VITEFLLAKQRDAGVDASAFDRDLDVVTGDSYRLFDRGRVSRSFLGWM